MANLCANCQSNPSKEDRVRNELADLYTLFSSKELPLVAAKVLIKSPEIPSSKWSFNNQVIMMMMGTNDARGFRQWEEVGRHVKMGSHADYILAPNVRNIPYHYCKTCQKTVLIGEDMEHEKEHEVRTHKVVTGFLAVPVFRYEDTYGKPLPVYKPKTIPPLTDVAKRWGISIEYRGSTTKLGSFRPMEKVITLSNEDPDTFFHELGHAAYFRNHPEKMKSGPIDHSHLDEEEAIAELTAATLARLYGYNSDAFSWNYIAHYAKSKDPVKVGVMVMRVMNEVQENVMTILNEEEKGHTELPNLVETQGGSIVPVG